MERYLRRNRLSEWLDGLGLCALLFLLACLWFTWLWGLNAASLVAGGALGILLCTARSQWRKRSVHRREKALRARIGAELMLESMLMAEAREAHLKAALLLQEKWPLILQEATEDGVRCTQGDTTLLIQCIRIPADGELGMGDLLSAQRAAKRHRAEKAVLCVLGKATPKVCARAELALIPLRIIRRETLLALAGRLSPATDEQLVELGRRRRRTEPQGSLHRLIFRPEKAVRYHLYGLMMLLLYLLCGAKLYALSGLICLTMGTLSRCAAGEGEKL